MNERLIQFRRKTSSPELYPFFVVWTQFFLFLEAEDRDKVLSSAAVPSHPVLVVVESVPVPRRTPTRERPEEVDALGQLVAVVHLGLRALVQVHHAGDGVQGTVHVQVAVADVGRASLDGKRKRSNS